MSMPKYILKKENMNSFLFILMWLVGIVYVVTFLYDIMHIVTAITEESGNLYKGVASHNIYFWPEHTTSVIHPFLTQLLYLIDLHYFSGSGFLLFTVNFVFFLFTGYLIYMVTQELFSRNSNDFLTYFMIFFVEVMWFTRLQEINIVWEFEQLRFAGLFFVLSSFLMLFHLHKDFSLTKFIGAVVLIVGSTGFSYDNIVALSLFILLLLWLRPKYYHYVALFLFLILLWFVWQYAKIIENAFLSLVNFNDFEHVLTYIGGMFFDVSGRECVSFSVVAGAVMVLSVGFLCYKVCFGGNTKKLPIVIIAFLIFYIAKSLFEPVETLDLEYYFLYKYQFLSISLLAWSLWFIIVVYYLSKDKRKVPLYGMWTIVLVLTGYQFLITPERLKYELGKVEMMMGVEKLSKLRRLYPNVEYNSYWRPLQKKSFFTQERLSEMVTNKKSIFATDLGLGEVYKLYSAEENLTGYIDRFEKVPKASGVFRITAWAYNTAEKKSPLKLYIVDSKNVLLGFAVCGMGRLDVEKALGKHARYSGCIGYLRVDNDLSDQKYYLVDKKRNLKRVFTFPKSIITYQDREMKEK